MQARRSYEKAEQVNVFATLSNFAREPVTCDLQLSIDGDVRAVRTVQIPAAEIPDKQQSVSPGKASITFSLSHAGAGLIEVRHLHKDQLSRDDVVWQVLEPPKSLAVLLVTQSNIALNSALRACPLARFDVCTPAEFESMNSSTLQPGDTYDVIVLDTHVPEKLSRGRYIVFGELPKGLGVSLGRLLKNQLIVDWRAQHPVLQYVNLTNLFVGGCRELILPPDAEVLGEFLECPAMVILRRHGSVFLLVPFNVMDSNGPFEPGFVAFCYNATAYLGLELGQTKAGGLQVGQAITIEALEPGLAVELIRPDQSKEYLRADSAGTLRCPSTNTAGVYSINIEGREVEHFAVNILDEQESNLAPVKDLVLSGQAVQAQKGPVKRSNVDLWPWLGGLALALVCLEWFVYNSRVRL